MKPQENASEEMTLAWGTCLLLKEGTGLVALARKRIGRLRYEDSGHLVHAPGGIFFYQYGYTVLTRPKALTGE